MSYSLVVATQMPPATRALEAWASEREAIEVEGALGGVERSAIVRRRCADGSLRPCAIVYPPEPVDEDAFPPALLDAVLGPRFRLRISVPGDSAEDRELATSLAAAIAEDARGAVYDPDADEIVVR